MYIFSTGFRKILKQQIRLTSVQCEPCCSLRYTTHSQTDGQI